MRGQFDPATVLGCSIPNRHALSNHSVIWFQEELCSRKQELEDSVLPSNRLYAHSDRITASIPGKYSQGRGNVHTSEGMFTGERERERERERNPVGSGLTHLEQLALTKVNVVVGVYNR